MNNFKKFFLLILVLALSVVTSCKKDDEEEEDNNQEVILNEVSFSNLKTTLFEGELLTINYTKQEGVTSTWSSSNTSVGEVNNNVITAKSVGEFKLTIVFSLGDKSLRYEYPITVLEADYSISYNLDGGVQNSLNSDTYNVLDLPVELNAPTKEGYTFSGWYQDNSYEGSPISSIAVGTTGNISLYAKWEKDIVTRTITYNLNGGTLPEGAVESFIEGQTVVLPIPEKDGYEFLGWALSNTSTKYITEVPATQNGNLTVYAKWKKIAVYSEITYYLNGGTNEEDAPLNYEEGKQLVLPIPEKEGYIFIGWTLEENSTTYLSSLPRTTKGAVSLYANWKESTHYTITYIYEDGMLPRHNATSHEEFVTAFWQDYYDFMQPKATLESFKASALSAWSGGAPGNYPVFALNGKESVNDSYFVNAKANVDRILPWFNAFDATVTNINSSQNAWEQQFVAYKRLYEVLSNSTASYWTAERKEAVYSAYLVNTPLVAEYDLGDEITLIELIIDDGRTFLGWYDDDGNKVEKITPTTKGNLKLTASWSASTPVETFEITNEITTLAKFTTHQLVWVLGPDSATNKKVKFASSDKTILTVNEEGLIEAHAEGTANITVTVLGNTALNVTLEITVYVDPFIDGRYVTESYVEPENTISISAQLYKLDGKILWKSTNEAIATVDENGVVSALKEGYVEIIAYAEKDPNVNLSFGVTVIPVSDSEFFKIIANAHNDEVYVVRGLDVAFGAYYTDVIGSVSDLFFNYDYKLIKDYYFERNNETMKSIEYITVHYSGMPIAHQDGEVIASVLYNNWKNNSLSASWHYSTGNDGIFQSMPDTERGGHAGDGTGASRSINWTNSGVKATANVKPTYGMQDGYLTINGQKSEIVLPTGTNMRLTWYGPAWKVENGYYYIAKLWYSDDYRYISCRGGNMNSIGIESACNEGSDLWYTYHLTAQLVANLLKNHKLDTTRVTGHHMWSGKDCPQTLLENNGELWYKFMELVEAEYALLNDMSNYTITAKSNNPEILSDNGRVLYVPNETTVVSYTVTVTNNTTGVTKKATFSSVIHGAYTE